MTNKWTRKDIHLIITKMAVEQYALDPKSKITGQLIVLRDMLDEKK